MERYDWTLDELKSLYDRPLLDLIYQAADVHRKHHQANEVQLCHLVSVKTGGCAEDCKYCAQSSRYQTDVEAEPLMQLDDVIERAREAKKNGSTRICLGAAWRKVRDNKQFDSILKMVKTINDMGLEVCCTLGMLTEDQAKKLKEAGLYAYNHNLDTSDRYYSKIITTRTYIDRLHTLAAVRDANISVCCGGIIGLGEEVEDRIRLIQTLASFNPHPESVPINRLVPIPGTPLGDTKQTSVWELLQTIAVCRIAMPTSMVRIAAGREKMSHAEQSLCFLAGANSIFIGEKLLTAPNRAVNSDEELLRILQLKPRQAFQEKEKTVCKSVANEIFLQEALKKRELEGNKRSLPRDDGRLIDLTSNDYLGFARSTALSDQIKAEYSKLISENGIRPYVGATGSRLLTGNRDYVENLEKVIADFHKAEASLIFNSGYVANIGLLSSVAGKEDCFIIDSQVHASTWEGVKLSGARNLLFRHNDLNQLEMQLKKASASHSKVFVCVESLYSMDGDIAPLSEISELAMKYSAHLIVDEAHATGVLGPRGEGLVVDLGLQEKVFARIHTFGKALGTHGAAVIGSSLLREFLINFSKPFIYTTAFPLHSYVSIMSVYQKLENAREEQDRLRELIHYFQSQVKFLDLPIKITDTPIQSIRVRSSQEADEVSVKLRNAGIDVRSIKTPTVRRGKECLRVCLHAFNTKNHVDQLLEQLSLENQNVFIA